MPPCPVRIALVDDHRIVRDGLRALIEKQPDLTVVGDAADGHSALAQLSEWTPDLVVMDIHMPGCDGIEVSRQILAVRPAVKIIVLSAEADPTYVEQALHVGIAGYLLKENAGDELILAIRAILSGQVYLCPNVTAAVIDRLRQHPAEATATVEPALSDRERQILPLIANGLRNREIAAKLKLSPKTVETYRSRMMAKLHVSSSAELVRYAVRKGYAQL
ncbi:MAG: response regulator transcription factor [Opitutae bacterium]|nr:response regulator transcription factor [Opitutae bacterium]